MVGQRRTDRQPCRRACPSPGGRHRRSGPHLKLLPPAVLDKLVHPLAQVPDERLGAQGAPGLRPLLQLLLQQGEPVQQLVQDQGQRRAGALGAEAAGRGTGSHGAGAQAQAAGQVGVRLPWSGAPC